MINSKCFWKVLDWSGPFTSVVLGIISHPQSGVWHSPPMLNFACLNVAFLVILEEIRFHLQVTRASPPHTHWSFLGAASRSWGSRWIKGAKVSRYSCRRGRHWLLLALPVVWPDERNAGTQSNRDFGARRLEMPDMKGRHSIWLSLSTHN